MAANVMHKGGCACVCVTLSRTIPAPIPFEAEVTPSPSNHMLTINGHTKRTKSVSSTGGRTEKPLCAENHIPCPTFPSWVVME